MGQGTPYKTHNSGFVTNNHDNKYRKTLTFSEMLPTSRLNSGILINSWKPGTHFSVFALISDKIGLDWLLPII